MTRKENELLINEIFENCNSSFEWTSWNKNI